MHRHNLDQIAEYAQGSLADETRARALVETCSTCRSEYETQRSIIEMLGATTTAQLSDYERSTLHRDVWTSLRNPTAPKPARSGTWWLGWALGGATVLFLAVGLLGVLDDPADQATDTFSEVDSAVDSDDAGGGDAPQATSAPAAEDGSESAETTVAIAEAATTVQPLESPSAYAAVAEDVRSTDEASLYAFAAEDERLAMSECLVEAGLGDFSAVTGFEELTDLIIAIPTQVTKENATVAFVDPETCMVVRLEE
jgi:hypothetical protein